MGELYWYVDYISKMLQKSKHIFLKITYGACQNAGV